jgi:hypothetical protein
MRQSLTDDAANRSNRPNAAVPIELRFSMRPLSLGVPGAKEAVLGCQGRCGPCTQTCEIHDLLLQLPDGQIGTAQAIAEFARKRRDKLDCDMWIEFAQIRERLRA